ncbi:MAG: sigma-54-dependent Fis family transcriptional regulator [Oligoflexales bacterium]|nr:sigma-54-dependent Fis family transcriptional regulator [Oligoflexales bacterium]
MEQFKNGNSALAHDVDKSVPRADDYLNYIRDRNSTEKKHVKSHVDFVFADEKMLRIKEVVSQIADTNVPILITGESGTGKEVVARLVHKISGRRDAPFVGVNCAALPSSLLESELFGFEKGAFTGAMQRHIGKFEQASGGTLLLDEITETDKSLQAKLLRAIQENEIQRIGGEAPQKVNTRIIATTNRDITASVKEGNFRQDLFYRLYVIHLEIPPLRERPKDIEVLVRHYLRTYGVQYGKPTINISADAMSKLVKYSWPGNVRELQNMIQRAVIMAPSDFISSHELNLETKSIKNNLDWVKYLPIGEKLQQIETQFILETLKKHNGNRTHSAKTLGISLRTLRNKINEFTVEGYEVPQPAATGKI